jgi:hypothetical protein
MPSGQGLADVLSGAAGAPVNRPQLSAFVANSQAMNGLHSAQTEEALLNAQRAQDEQVASGQLEDAFMQGGVRPAQAHLMAVAARMHAGSAVNAMDMFKAYNASVLGDPSKLGSSDQTAAQQAISGKVAEPVPLPNNFTTLPGTPPVVPQQSTQGVAQTAETNALAGLTQHKNTDPAAFRASTFGATSDAGVAALGKAVSEGRLDPTRINSRTAPILAQMEMSADPNNPPNYNRLHADAQLQGNATFQQRAMSVDMLPGLLTNLVATGKKLNGGAGYNDVRTVGQMQKWANGEINDPDYTEFMTTRNDALLRIASVMRGVGMSDQAHTAEVEAMSPTLAPYALDAWLKGQMAVINPLLERQNKITHLGEKGQGTPRLGASSAAPPTPTPAPLGSTVPTPGGLPSYTDEAAALAAGHHPGDRVMIGGVTGTLQ